MNAVFHWCIAVSVTQLFDPHNTAICLLAHPLAGLPFRARHTYPYNQLLQPLGLAYTVGNLLSERFDTGKARLHDSKERMAVRVQLLLLKRFRYFMLNISIDPRILEQIIRT
ncbi:MAG: hypothetical protein M3Y39_03070 [Chloroflexota bacterium]|nr:hypothetical protein [Chloroflexota bacterium]